MSNLLYYLIQNFFVGGLVIASVSYISTFLSPLLGAIWWSFPITLIPSMYFMHVNSKNNKHIAKFIMGTFIGYILLLISSISFIYYLHKYNNSNNILYPIVFTFFIWLFFSLILYCIIKKSDYINFFE
tara:strand:- start:210 stop:593 length:384 start_codon:yes stop_codon:yes gene_type:complete